MPDLLLELFSEEIPARMQAGAAKDLERMMVGALTDRGYLFEAIKAFAGPRRLTLAISGLPTKQSDVREELKGPKTDAPPAALDGFLRKTGLRIDQIKVDKTPKGDVYMAVIERQGRETPMVLAEIIPEVMAKLPWPKSMRWKPGLSTRWIRPLHSILCTFDGELVAFSFAGISSGQHTRGHRFLSQGKIEARRFDDYVKKLRDAHVILEAEERAAIIFEGVKQAAFVRGLEMIPDEGLLSEVAGLAEWPVVYIGTIQDEFMELPPEILQTAMRTHQRYFSLRKPAAPGNNFGEMANRFALVANMIATDGGKEIVAGNERVLRARLSDAKFFWDEDRKHSLDSRVEKLKDMVFHARLGSQYERVMRIEKLAGEIAPRFGADGDKSKRAGRLCKADLTSGMVGEFPELQGVMGRYYALYDKEDPSVAEAVGDHYGPVGKHPPSFSAITNAVSVADKWDTISQFFKIGEKPTGSGDPYAIRRAALGIIRIVLDRKYRICLSTLPDSSDELLSFFAERLKVALRESGTRHDLIDAIFSLGNEDDLVRLVAQVEALQSFLKTDDGANLLSGYKRAANILKLEEKKDAKIFTGNVDEGLLSEAAEKTLFVALAEARTAIATALQNEGFAAAMQRMAALRVPVDAFFDGVMVNSDDRRVRENRLNLLASLRATLHQVADFSKVEG
jgi:glycyl-tRNA synthetase beta chain